MRTFKIFGIFLSAVLTDFFTTDIMTKRPEQLTISQFVELTNYVGEELKRLEMDK